MLLTVARYRAITGDNDTTSAAVSARIEDAEDMLSEALERPLEAAQRTARLWPDRSGMIWPPATPITAAAGWTIEGDGLKGGPYYAHPSIIDPDGRVEVTYTGGWVERSANPSATNRLPAVIEDDLAWAVHALTRPAPAQFPTGAVSVSLGDASVNFGPGGAPGRSASRVSWSRRTMRYRHQLAAAVPGR